MRPRHHDHLLDVVHAEGRALILGLLIRSSMKCPFAGYWRPAGAGIAGERAALDIEMTALPHDASGITVGDVEGASFRVPSNR